jgi:hypothetical protein
MPKKKDDVALLLHEIHRQLKRQNSLRFIFLQGITRGFGTALAATVLVAIVTSLTIQFADAEAFSSLLTSIFGSIF